jgi:UDPglucose 6-dehydrogenase
LILTEWEEFRQLDWQRISDLMVRPMIIDGRNLLDPAAMMERGFEYSCFGRPIENQTAPKALTHAPQVLSASAHVASAPS